ncbi:MAG: insulinase family protein [Porphyromonadaceae bacterium]|nr:insulinase family protein [Porphyromonadaceae bacterium]
MNVLSKLRRSVVALTSGALLAVATVASAQQLPPPLPADSALRMGQLENGLTYFIRKNALPEGRADFYIAQKVGSMQEEDSQMGLAHFLEHIAFNGTKNFPGKGMINWLETIGVRFGSGINAYTSFDETVYTLINVPVERQSVVDSCLLILHDWSNAISLEDKEIDNERGVIQEEWRSRDSGNQRISEKSFEAAFPGNRYGKRMPIGSMDIVRNFKYQELRDYYKKWYRPDLQALIIVGDIDVDHVEATIKKQFADVPKPVNPAERVYTPVEDNEAPISIIATDPEGVGTRISIAFKTDVTPAEVKATVFGVAENYIKSVVSAMVNERFEEITKKPNTPFIVASSSFGPYFHVAKTKDAWTFNAVSADGKYKPALQALVAEIERVRQHGFTEGELKRAKKNFIVGIKTAYNERAKRKNSSFTSAYVDHFINGTTLADIETLYPIYEQFAEMIPLAQINGMAQQLLGETNIAVALTGPEKPEFKYPTQQELVDQFLAARKQPVEPYKEAVSDEKLMKTMPKAGKIVKEDKQGQFGSTVWTLSNGVKVVYKVTDFKEDQIMMSATRHGGLASFPKADPTELRMINEISSLGGVAEFDETALGRVLTGRVVSLDASLGQITDGLSGHSSKEDLETLLQLVHLSFTAPRLDKQAYEAFREKMANVIQTQKSNPMSSVGDSINAAIYPGDKLFQSVSVEELNAMSYEGTMKLYKERMTNAKDFQFVFVGNIEPEKFRPLVELYLASLPVKKNLDTKPMESRLPRIRRGEYTNHYTKKQSTPAGLVFDFISGTLPYSQRNTMIMSIAGEVLNQVYIATIREEEGGTYGANASASVTRFPEGEAKLQVAFQTDPAKAHHLNKIVYAEIERIAQEGAKAENFDKVIENMKKSHATRLKENGYWLSQLSTYYFRGIDNVSQYESTLASIKREDIAPLIKQLLAQKNRIEVMLMPEAETK